MQWVLKSPPQPLNLKVIHRKRQLHNYFQRGLYLLLYICRLYRINQIDDIPISIWLQSPMDDSLYSRSSWYMLWTGANCVLICRCHMSDRKASKLSVLHHFPYRFNCVPHLSQNRMNKYQHRWAIFPSVHQVPGDSPAELQCFCCTHFCFLSCVTYVLFEPLTLQPGNRQIMFVGGGMWYPRVQGIKFFFW